ncbi:MAG: universal stress protein [Dehalococcoidia bacterium]|nr:MAG: universal stress protein [bacterium]MCE7929142.1 universal stress protein [Chloroflexi bacterium CFX7]MCK6564742.1 universal stress protein [Dehalococcoidia bacterium]MCL4232865.1 universal stress protein [Dehalococcoidia bacterium]NUQ56519.1 universal stress protein [Dehalococcoidia bacterium]
MPGHASVLVPLDGSKNAENALPMAALLARAYDLPVRLLHVIDDTDEVLTPQALDRAQEVFSSYALDLAARHGVDTSKAVAEVGYGSPAATILAAAQGVRFVVIATHGRGGFVATFIGSVADKVVRGADVPVVTVPGVGEPSALDRKPVLVALDGSPEAEAGLRDARELAGRADLKLTLVRAISVPPPVGIEFAYYPPDILTTMQAAAQDYLKSVARPGEETRLVHGGAALAIEQTAAEIDAGLIVMTSRGKGLAARLALGSTTDRVLHSVQRPLLIVPVPES